MVSNSPLSMPVFGSDDEVPAGDPAEVEPPEPEPAEPEPPEPEPADVEPPDVEPDPDDAEPVDDWGDAPLPVAAAGGVVEPGAVVALAGVGFGEAAATTIVPCMKLWTRQW
jgi:hypothetical protein